MAGSLILILLGLVAFGLRSGIVNRTMYNIDFTGGTLVTIQLDETDPTVQALSESKRAEFVRSTATSVLPDVTVESLRVAEDKSLTRFNIRTTEQEANKVKDEILKAFGPTLERVQMKVGAERPIAGAPAAEAAKGGPRSRPALPADGSIL